MPRVTVVGIGLGPEDLGKAHLDAIQKAEILVGGKKQLAMFAGLTESTWTLGANPRATLEEVRDKAAGKRVVILASGDPLFFGIGKRALEVFGPENLTFLPNLTALQKTFARLKLPWNQARAVSVHGRKATDFFAELAHPGPIAIYTDPENRPDRMAKLLREYGMTNRKVAVVEEIGSDQERCLETNLAEAEGMQFAPVNVMVLYPEEEKEPAARLGLEDELFAKDKSLITKRESRALILAELQIEPQGVMWDVGAGSGSVGIEAVRLAPGLRVYAVEKDRARLEMIQENVKRLGGFGVKAVLGEAPGALEDLPDPDRVFVGGSGGNLTDILEIVEKRLRPGGRTVVSVVTLETLARAQRIADKAGLAHEWLLLQVGRTVPIQSDKEALMSRFQAQTPLFLLSMWRA
ncbi:MAG: precorrin-6y C5,15-methyltransferase (decarboxylating) subunit CbiE [Deltaproteobacteria bacterium]|nr:MAG: precorrin-6y C5,15-methyltransferase (decarboxylating) subunit CbiE [Deltaproteobacteria bacterium]